VTRLTHFVRGLLVAIAALALMAGAAVAARGLTPTTPVGGSHGDPAGPATHDAKADPNGSQDGDETRDGDEAETPDTDAPDSNAAADRPQNHGWFVSEAAKGPTPATGFDNHGAYVSSIAKGTAGKPDAASTSAVKAAAGKAKGAAAKDTHAGN
jgi:hypothetical protein